MELFILGQKQLLGKLSKFGFTSAIRTLEEFYIVTWINVDDWQGLKIEDVNVSKFDSEYDLLFVKSNWHWTVDTFVRKYMRNENANMFINISGVATPPEPLDHSGDELSTNKFDEIQFYNLLFYETEWYRPKLPVGTGLFKELLALIPTLCVI